MIMLKVFGMFSTLLGVAAGICIVAYLLTGEYYAAFKMLLNTAGCAAATYVAFKGV